MFGFLKFEAEVLGSKGRFSKRIEKFRTRNKGLKSQYSTSIELKKNILEAISKGENLGEHTGVYAKTKTKRPIIWLHPVIEHHFWWLTHNWAAHFLIGLVPVKPFFDFHDWTSKKLNAE